MVLRCARASRARELRYHWKDLTRLELLRLHLEGLFSADVFFLKFALDPLNYAWRLAQYRRALKSLLVCRRQRIHIDGVISVSLDNHTLASRRMRKQSHSRSRARVGEERRSCEEQGRKPGSERPNLSTLKP